MATPQELAERIAAKPYPKVISSVMESRIVDTQYWQPEGTCLTVCMLRIDNGYTVCGESGCADPRNFDAQLGRDLARQAAFNKLWPLFGFALAEDLKEGRVE